MTTIYRLGKSGYEAVEAKLVGVGLKGSSVIRYKDKLAQRDTTPRCDACLLVEGRCSGSDLYGSGVYEAGPGCLDCRNRCNSKELVMISAPRSLCKIHFLRGRNEDDIKI